MTEEIKTQVVCDRCRKTVEGMELIQEDTIAMTGGYYKRGTWKKYMDEDESIVCDDCMHADSRYAKDYPVPAKGKREPVDRQPQMAKYQVMVAGRKVCESTRKDCNYPMCDGCPVADAIEKAEEHKS
jgi:hypothetical protein